MRLGRVWEHAVYMDEDWNEWRRKLDGNQRQRKMNVKTGVFMTNVSPKKA